MTRVPLVSSSTGAKRASLESMASIYSRLNSLLFWLVAIVAIPISAAQADDGVDQPAAKAALLKAYPGLFAISGNTLTWTDGTAMVWDDGRTRNADELIESPDIEDMFHYVYPRATTGELTPSVDFDPGRRRNEAFFKKLYGASEEEVSRHLVSVRWLPKLGNTRMQFTSIFDVDECLIKISNEFQDMPEHLARFGLKPEVVLNGESLLELLCIEQSS
jgi:peptidoglycan L-alanyl-D-glutamate endopeptidase CwlK